MYEINDDQRSLEEFVYGVYFSPYCEEKSSLLLVACD